MLVSRFMDASASTNTPGTIGSLTISCCPQIAASLNLAVGQAFYGYRISVTFLMVGKSHFQISHQECYAAEFGLENGREQLSAYFSEVNLYVYKDALLVTEIEPLVDYILDSTAKSN